MKENYLVKYEKMSWREVAIAPVSAISGGSGQDTAGLKSSFHIGTVRDLAANE